MAATLENSNDYAAALSVLTNASERIPGSPDILEETAVVQLRLRLFSESVKTSEKLIDLCRKNPKVPSEFIEKAQLNVAAVFAEKPDDPAIKAAFAHVIASIDKELKAAPEDEIMLTRKADVLRAAKMFESAIGIYRSINEIEKDNLFIPLQIARTYMEKGDNTKAQAEFEKSIRENPRNFRAYRNLGWYFMEMGRKENGVKALPLFEKADANFHKALDLSDLPIDVSFNKLKIAQVGFYRWKATGIASDKTKALAEFDEYKKNAPEWISTDVADVYIDELRGRVAKKTWKRQENELEILPAVK